MFLVRAYNSKKYLSTDFDNTIIKEIANIGQVVDPNEDEIDNKLGITQTIENVCVVGVLFLKEDYECLKCSSKVITSYDTEIGKCVKCFMEQSLLSCKSTLNARVMIKTSNQLLTLTAYGEVLNDISNSIPVTAASLLKAPPFTVVVKEQVIHSILRT